MTNKNNNTILTDIQLEKREKRRKLLFSSLISLGSSVLLVLFALSWQDRYDLLAWCNAFYFSGFIFFFVGWIILMTNMNILSPFVYGMKTFFLMFAGKKPKVDYYTYTQERKENPIPRLILLTPFLASIPNIIVAVVLHVLL